MPRKSERLPISLFHESLSPRIYQSLKLFFITLTLVITNVQSNLWVKIQAFDPNQFTLFPKKNFRTSSIFRIFFSNVIIPSDQIGIRNLISEWKFVVKVTTNKFPPRVLPPPCSPPPRLRGHKGRCSRLDIIQLPFSPRGCCCCWYIGGKKNRNAARSSFNLKKGIITPPTVDRASSQLLPNTSDTDRSSGTSRPSIRPVA